MAEDDTSTTARQLRERLDAQLRDHDKSAAVHSAIDAVQSGALSVPELYRDVLTPLLTDTGYGWQRGEIHVWEEHLRSAVVRTIVEALYPQVLRVKASATPVGRSVLLACPPEEGHDLGLRMVADRFEMAGWTVYFLGADTPLDELVDASGRLGVEALALSSSTHFHRVALRRHIDRLRRELPDVRIWLGGPAFCDGRERWNDELLDLDALLGDGAAAVPGGDGASC